MSLSLDFTIKKGDLLPELAMTLYNFDGTAFNLTGVTSMTFRFRHIQSGTLRTGSATVVDGVNGKVKYTWQTGDTDLLGTYKAELEVNFSGSKETFPNTTPNYIFFEIIDKV